MPPNSSSSSPLGNPAPQQPRAEDEPPANETSAAEDEANQQHNNVVVPPRLMHLIQQELDRIEIAHAQQRGFYLGLCMGPAVAFLVVALGYLIIKSIDF